MLATLIRGGGGSQAQDHGQAIYAKIQYSVSSTFATVCSIFKCRGPYLQGESCERNCEVIVLNDENITWLLIQNIAIVTFLKMIFVII